MISEAESFGAHPVQERRQKQQAAATLMTSEQLKYLEQLLGAPLSLNVPSGVGSSHGAEDDSVPLPLEYVEFELKQSKEYMAKLKFNLLELTSKRVFLDKLMPSGSLQPDLMSQSSQQDATISLYDEWTNCQTRWSPGDVKDLERQVEAKKAELKTVKEAILAVKTEISNVAEHVVGARDACEAVRSSGNGRVKELAGIMTEIEQLERNLAELAAVREATRPSGLARCESCEDVNGHGNGSEIGQLMGLRSVEELQEELAGLEVSLASRSAAKSAHLTNIDELGRLLTLQASELSVLEQEAAQLRSLLTAKQQPASATSSKPSAELTESEALEQLCVWHRSELETVAELTGMHFEMLRPDYLLVTLRPSGSALPVHLHIEPPTGRLLAARIGSNGMAPRDDWTRLCVEAVENNDICTLLHCLQHC